MTNAELREFCTQMIGKFKLLSDIQKEMQYETIDAKFTEWELKKLIFALNVLREEVRKYVDTADTPQTEGYMTVEQAEDYRKMLDKAEHKVYGNITDTPQTDCDTCRHDSEPWDSDKCDGCSKAHSNYEPQTDCGWK